MANDDPFYSANALPAPLRLPKQGELLFEFLRASDGAPMSCELRFNGESYGWEAQFFERGELWFSRGAFVTRALAVQWAEMECRTWGTNGRWSRRLAALKAMDNRLSQPLKRHV